MGVKPSYSMWDMFKQLSAAGFGVRVRGVEEKFRRNFLFHAIHHSIVLVHYIIISKRLKI